MNAPKDGVLRCPKDCPERKPGCHNAETCECWAKQVAQRRKKYEAKRDLKYSYPRNWEQRGIIKKGVIKK